MFDLSTTTPWTEKYHNKPTKKFQLILSKQFALHANNGQIFLVVKHIGRWRKNAKQVGLLTMTWEYLNFAM
jgi:hypothetical protein